MAGRAAAMRLLSFSHRESAKVTLLRGGYPEVLARPAAAEIIKSQVHAGGGLSLIECKAGRTVTPAMAGPISKLAESLRPRRPKGFRLDLVVLHRGPAHPTTALAPGVRALPWRDYFQEQARTG